jgi:hypothetical protein
MKYCFSTIVVAIVFLTSVAGCVPYPVWPDVSTSTTASIDDELLLTLAPREYLEDFSEKIIRSYKNIEVVDGMLFRDTAFPDGGWELQQFLEPKNYSRVRSVLDLDYVVILGEEELVLGDVEGIFIPFFGAGAQKKESRVSAAIFDLTSGKFERQINVEAVGHEGGFFLVIVGGGAKALTESSAIKGLAKETGRVIGELVGSEKTRIAVIAATASFNSPNEAQ